MILETVRKAVGEGTYRIDDDSNSVAAVVDYDGPDGAFVLDGYYTYTGEFEKSHSGMYLYITTSVVIIGDSPRIRFISRLQPKSKS